MTVVGRQWVTGESDRDREDPVSVVLQSCMVGGQEGTDSESPLAGLGRGQRRPAADQKSTGKST